MCGGGHVCHLELQPECVDACTLVLLHTCTCNWGGSWALCVLVCIVGPTCICLAYHVDNQSEIFFCAHQKMCSCVHYYVKKIHNRLTDKDLHDSSGKFYASEQVCPEGRGGCVGKRVCREEEGMWGGGCVEKRKVCGEDEGVWGRGGCVGKRRVCREEEGMWGGGCVEKRKV